MFHSIELVVLKRSTSYVYYELINILVVTLIQFERFYFIIGTLDGVLNLKQ